VECYHRAIVMKETNGNLAEGLVFICCLLGRTFLKIVRLHAGMHACVQECISIVFSPSHMFHYLFHLHDTYLCTVIFNLLVITSCNVLDLNGDFQDGGFGLFQFQIPDTDQGQCVQTRTLGELEGRYSGFFWAPNNDKVCISLSH
jgi:hypothetical protein